jgi:hypothetical protein
MTGAPVTGVIVTTTINPPTEAVRRFDVMEGWHLVVVGDRKTPPDYRLERGTYLSPADQEAIDPDLSDLIGWNRIPRRNFGFLVAHRMGAEVVATIDDDNLPMEGWGRDLLVGRPAEVTLYRTDLPAFDPVGATNHPHLWHRGYPLQLLSRRDYSDRTTTVVTADVQADFWDGDPDVDAICRMQYEPRCAFDPGCFPMAGTAMAPFNSQNTFIGAGWLRDYFLFPHVGRMDDIWAAYHLQARGAKVVFGPPSVVQERNPHDPVIDMRAEYLGYEHNLEIVESLRDDPDAIARFVPPRALQAFERYRSLF